MRSSLAPTGCAVLLGALAKTSAVLLAAFLHASCMNVSPPGVTFASEPPGARVQVDGQDSGWVTPCMIALTWEEVHVVTLALEGHVPHEILLVPEERLGVSDWRQGASGVNSTIRFPFFQEPVDFFFPLREVRALAPGRVFVRLRPAETP